MSRIEWVGRLGSDSYGQASNDWMVNWGRISEKDSRKLPGIVRLLGVVKIVLLDKVALDQLLDVAEHRMLSGN